MPRSARLSSVPTSASRPKPATCLIRGYGVNHAPQIHLFRTGSAAPRAQHDHRIHFRRRPPLPLHDARRLWRARPRRRCPHSATGSVRRWRSRGSCRRRISQTVGGEIHDAGGRQTIWRRRVCLQRAAHRARFCQLPQLSETGRVSFQLCTRGDISTLRGHETAIFQKRGLCDSFL